MDLVNVSAKFEPLGPGKVGAYGIVMHIFVAFRTNM